MKNFSDNERRFALIYFDNKCENENYAVSDYFNSFKEEQKEKPIVSLQEAISVEKTLLQNDLTSIFYTDEEFAELPNNHIVKAFYKTLSSWYVPSDGDCTFGIGFGEGTRSKIRSNFGIDLDETILFERDTSFWSNDNQGLVITDCGFYCIPDNDNASSRFAFSWKDFDRVRYKELRFYFYSGQDEIAQLAWKMFYKGLNEGAMRNRGPVLASVLTEIANLAPADIDPLDLANEGKFNEALELVDENIANDANNSYLHYAKGRILYLIEGNKETPDNSNLDLAQAELNKSLNLMDGDEDEFKSICYANMGFVSELQGNNFYARNCYVMALDGCGEDNKDNFKQYLSTSEDALKEIWDNYTAYDYNDRKFIMPVKDSEIGGCCANGIDVFRMSNIPSCFTFPTGHPVANQLYIGHPYNPSLYVPLEMSEDMFFLDKVHELCYLLECLGAEEISITSIKGKNVTEFSEQSIGGTGSADIKLFSGDVERSQNRTRNQELSSHQQRTMKIKLDPLKKPYVPEGLIWYNEQPQWQRLVTSRLNGNMLEYNEFVSNSQTKFTSSTELSDIKSSARYLWTKVGLEVDMNEKTQFQESEETQWKVEVRFRSIKDFDNAQDAENAVADNNTSAQLTDKEKEYAEEVRFCLEDGEIGDKERRFLNRIRTKLGIGEERAAEIETMLSQPQLSDDEHEYLDALKDEIVDGMIPEKSRKLLNRLRMSLDISTERAKELEKIAISCN